MQQSNIPWLATGSSRSRRELGNQPLKWEAQHFQSFKGSEGKPASCFKIPHFMVCLLNTNLLKEFSTLFPIFHNHAT